MFLERAHGETRFAIEASALTEGGPAAQRWGARSLGRSAL
jgi:hypothetical protein